MLIYSLFQVLLPLSSRREFQQNAATVAEFSRFDRFMLRGEAEEAEDERRFVAEVFVLCERYPVLSDYYLFPLSSNEE
jgi:hypothetical protein